MSPMGSVLDKKVDDDSDDEDEGEIDDKEEMAILDDDDGSDSMAQDVSSSYNSPDVEKQDNVKASLVGEVGQVPGGMLLQFVAVLNLGTPMLESLLFSSIPLKQHTEEHTSFRQVGNQTKLCD